MADHLGFASDPYDALMDEFEPGARVSQIEPLFAELRQRSVALLERLQGAPQRPDASLLTRHYPQAAQERVSRRVRGVVAV